MTRIGSNLPRQPAGHFAGIQFYHDTVDSSKWRYRLPGPAGTSMAIDMETLETVPAARATADGRRDQARPCRRSVRSVG